MGNYSHVSNMIQTRGIMIITQSESIISPTNKDKLPITNMQLAFKTIFGVQANTNYEGDEVDLVDGDGGDDGADGDVDGDASPTSRRSGDNDGVDFPFTGGTDAAGVAISRSRSGLSPSPPPQ
jgi:hypothetical protein